MDFVTDLPRGCVFVFSSDFRAPFPPKYVSINSGISWIKPAAWNTCLQGAFAGAVDCTATLAYVHCNNDAKKANPRALPVRAAIANLPTSLAQFFSSRLSRIVFMHAAQHELNAKSTTIQYMAKVVRVGHVPAPNPMEPRHMNNVDRAI